MQWERRFTDRSAQYEYGRRRAAEAQAAGRTFSTFLQLLEWPHLEVLRYLKGRGSAVSLQDLEENGDFVRSVPHRVVWQVGTAL